MVSSSSDSSRDSVRGGALVAFRMACESAWCLSALYIMSSTLCTAPALQCSHTAEGGVNPTTSGLARGKRGNKQG